MTDRELLIIERTQLMVLKIARLQVRMARQSQGHHVEGFPEYRDVVRAIREVDPGYEEP